jgi:hypothetical protein
MFYAVFAFSPRQAPWCSRRLKISQKCTARRAEYDCRAQIRIACYIVFLFFVCLELFSPLLLLFLECIFECCCYWTIPPASLYWPDHWHSRIIDVFGFTWFSNKSKTWETRSQCIEKSIHWNSTIHSVFLSFHNVDPNCIFYSFVYFIVSPHMLQSVLCIYIYIYIYIYTYIYMYIYIYPLLCVCVHSYVCIMYAIYNSI